MHYIPSRHQQEIIDKGKPSLKARQFSHSFSLNIHGIPCQFHFNSENLVRPMESFFPDSWRQSFLEETPIEVYWVTPQEFLAREVPLWGEVSSPDCHFIEDWVLQRDFASFRIDEKNYFLIAEDQINDGIFNFLRYLLPQELLQVQSVLFHSSCVVDENRDAYLFYGPSGAGKTTMSQLCGQGEVLGDDMNLLRIIDKKVFVEPALVGQRYFSSKSFAQIFQVKAGFWLVKDEKISIEPLKKGRLNRLLSSFSGLFWDQLNLTEYQKVFYLAQVFSQKLNLNELKFNQTQEVWDHVRVYGKNL